MTIDTAKYMNDPNRKKIDNATFGRAPAGSAVVVNKFILDGNTFPGDVVVGFALAHCPMQWVETGLVDMQQTGYLPCKPALRSRDVVVVKRKNGMYIVLAGTISRLDPKFKARVLKEHQLYKGALAEKHLALAQFMEGMTPQEMSAVSTGAAKSGMPPGAPPMLPL